MYNDSMLTKRQQDLIAELNQVPKKTASIEYLMNHFNVGSRSLRNDINAINAVEQETGIQIEADSQGSYCLSVTDANDYSEYIREYAARPNYYFNDQNSRVDYILARLLSADTYITSAALENEMYLSRSRMTSDLSKVRTILAPYQLSLKITPHHGLSLEGAESSKRKLIISRNILLFEEISGMPNHGSVNPERISRILTEALLKWQYRVSDIVFQNLVLHLSTSIHRLKSGFYLEKSDDLKIIYRHASDISSEIYRQISAQYHVPYSEEEVKCLAVSLQCKREYDLQDSISEDTNSFVLKTLEIIRDKYNVDFTGDLNLRMNLALHTKPLIVRIQSDIQLNNAMTFDIKQKFSYAFDLASEYSYHLTSKYGIRLSDDEISYLALHFIVGLRRVEQSKASKRILLISEQRKSNTILIQQQILQWFKDDVQGIDLTNAHEMSEFDLNRYDAILTTTESVMDSCSNAVLINFFLTEADHQKIEMALSGITNSADVLHHFHKHLFYAGPCASKSELIQILCGKSESMFPTSGRLLHSIMLHETITSTYFGNGVAMPHPDQPMTDQSFISVGIPDKPLLWEGEESASLVLLVSIEKDNPAALQIWQYLSYLLSDEDIIQRIIDNPTYENFTDSIAFFYRRLLGR